MEDKMNQLMRFEDLREWLMSQIDGSEETRGDDGLISDFIRQIDALPSEIAEPRGCPTPGACSCPGAIPDAERKEVMTARALAESIVERATVETPITQALVSMLEAGWLSLGSSAPGAVKPLVEALEAFERELIDIKGRLLPQYKGRAERAENEKDAMLEKLIAAQKVISGMTAGVSEWADAWRERK
jgi:hypothetical protein